MCNQETKHFQTTSHENTNKRGSRRRRLWELSRESHCPVIGVCIPLQVLRRLIAKALGAEAQADDYTLHVGAIAESAHRSRLSEILQIDLEKRYVVSIQHFRVAKTPEALLGLWLEAVHCGDVAGAFWATLTHPQCTDIIEENCCRQMHMLQHQAGAGTRVDLHRFNALTEEHALVVRELGKLQERSTRLINEKLSELKILGQQLVQLRANSIAKDSQIDYLRSDLHALQSKTADVEYQHRLEQKNHQLDMRIQELEKHNRELKQEILTSKKHKSTPVQTSAILENPRPKTIPITLELKQKNILCVGGRPSQVPNYRNLIERGGGRFYHHDGGLEDKQNLLGNSLAAADLVICQTGCISHNAYWRVKEFCKRTGKPCVFVENPSISSLERGLELITLENEN